MGADPALDVRLRVRFTKLGKVRFTSHRDVARMWERALRRSDLPVAWSEGFSPRPLLSFGLALPTCCESLGEYLDVRLRPEDGADPLGPPGATWDATSGDVALHTHPGLDLLPGMLSPLLPEGMDVQRCAVPERGAGSLQQEVTSCSWELEVLGVGAGELATRVERLLSAPRLMVDRERKGRAVTDDLRPAILHLIPMGEVAGPNPADRPTVRLRAELATHPRGVRPGELLEGLGADLVLARACRTQQWIERDGVRSEPLSWSGPGHDASASHAQERAS